MKFSIFLFLISLSASANHDTQKYWLPTAHGLIGTFNYHHSDTRMSSLDNVGFAHDNSANSDLTSLSFDYGLADFLSIGFSQGYKSTTARRATFWVLQKDQYSGDLKDYAGPTDFSTRIKSKFFLESATLYVCLSGSMSWERSEYSVTDGKGNAFTGGVEISPSLAYVTQMRGGKTGFEAGYSFYSPRKLYNRNPDSIQTFSGGSGYRFGPFLEIPYELISPGAALSFSHTNISTPIPAIYRKGIMDTPNKIGLQAWAVISLDESLEVIPGVDFALGIKSSTDTATYKQFQSGGFSLAFRFIF